MSKISKYSDTKNLSKSPALKQRYFEIDALRGIAITLMITYHLLFDLNYFAGQSFNLWSGYLWFIGRSSAFIFIFLVGISLTLSFSEIKTKPKNKEIFRKYFLRGAKIFSWGLMITAMTHIFLNHGTIYFGILHFIGLSIVLAIPFLRYKKINLIIGSIIFITGIYFKDLVFKTSYFLFLGLKPESLYTLDYFPLFPWFGVILVGIFFGNTFYMDGKRKFSIPDIKKQLIPLSYLGRNSLLIYLIHQPLLIVLIRVIYLLFY